MSGTESVESSVQWTPRGVDRRQKRQFVLWNRRSGFERRKVAAGSPAARTWETTLVYLRDHPDALAAVLVAANILSMLDLTLTTVLIRLGVAVEANPFMREAFEMSTAHAVFAKLGLLVAASLGLWLLRRWRLALEVALLILALYTCLVIYEIYGLVQVL